MSKKVVVKKTGPICECKVTCGAGCQLGKEMGVLGVKHAKYMSIVKLLPLRA
jgi:hypothetical protein